MNRKRQAKQLTTFTPPEPTHHVWKFESGSWHFYTASLRIAVHHRMDHDKPEDWFVSYHEAGLERSILLNTDLEKAKLEAIKRVRNRLQRLLKELPV
jgi:hypothetical protein